MKIPDTVVVNVRQPDGTSKATTFKGWGDVRVEIPTLGEDGRWHRYTYRLEWVGGKQGFRWVRVLHHIVGHAKARCEACDEEKVVNENGHCKRCAKLAKRDH